MREQAFIGLFLSVPAGVSRLLTSSAESQDIKDKKNTQVTNPHVIPSILNFLVSLLSFLYSLVFFVLYIMSSLSYPVFLVVLSKMMK